MITKTNITRLLKTVLGVFFVSIGISLFQLPNKIVTGGVGGISTILYHAFSIPPGLTIAAVNIVLLIISYKALGKEFVLKTLFSVAMLSVFTQLLSYLPPITKNVLYASIFGGCIYGLGIGIVFAQKSSTGGTDIIARILQIFFPNLPIGKLLLFVDGTIIFASLLVFRTAELVMAGIICVTVSTFVVDSFIKKLNYTKVIFVISDQFEEIAKQLIDTSPRGITMVDVRGGFTFRQKGMLFCVLKNSELWEFQKKVLAIDPTAFIVISCSEQIIGNGFKFYR